METTHTKIRWKMINNNSPLAMIFPGASVDPCGAEADFLLRHGKVVKPFLAQASDFAGVDLAKAMANGTTEALEQRQHQLLGFAFSCGVAAALKSSGFTFGAMAGYSLGVYSMLVAADVIDFNDGCQIVNRAYDLLVEAAGNKEYAMVAIIGFSADELSDLIRIKSTGELLTIIRNNDTCFVMTGEKPVVTAFTTSALEAGAIKVSQLKINLPCHHPKLLASGAQKLRESLESIPFRKTSIPLISSIDQAILTDTRQVRDFIASNLCTPINWLATMDALRTNVSLTFFECGMGLSLTQTARFLPWECDVINTKNCQWRLGL